MRKDSKRGPKEDIDARMKPLMVRQEVVVRETEKGWQRFKECRSSRAGHTAVWRRNADRAPHPSAAPHEVPPATAAAAIWGTVLTTPAGPAPGDDFDARVQRAWGYIKSAHFSAEEHDRLREELGRLIAEEGTRADK